MKKFNLKTSYFHKQEAMKNNKKNMIKIFWLYKKFFEKIPYPHGRGINNKVKIIIVKKQPI